MDALERFDMDVGKSVFFALLCLLLVNCDDRPPAETSSQFKKTTNPGCEGQSIQGEYLVHWKNGAVTVEHASDDHQFQDEFLKKHQDEILLAEPHYQIRVSTPQDFHQKAGWGNYVNWGIDAIGAEGLWEVAPGDSDVVVAVIDSGVDIGHPQLVGALYSNPNEIENGLDDDGNGYIDDIHGYDFVAGTGKVRDYTGHGTHVAGTIVAQHDSGEVMGVAPNVKLLSLGFINDGGGGSVSHALDAITYAVSQQARVINASWGGDNCSVVLQQAIESLASHNVLFVTAAGNRGNNIDFFPEYPAAFEIDNMITVGSSSFAQLYPEQVMSDFTNYGERVDIMAPGDDIYSTVPAEFDQDGPLDGMARSEGTSMAAPHVAGAAALLWSLNPDASYSQIKQALLQGARSGPFRVRTRGSLDLPGALRSLHQ
jgi:subtilisin family serine protease